MRDRVDIAVECPPLEALSAFILGQTPPSDLETIASHLETCEGCAQRLLNSHESADRLVDRLRQHLSGHFERTTDVLPYGRRGQLAPLRHDDEPFPRFFGPYLLLGTLGRGGMGVVYKARDPLKRVVALKVAVTDQFGDSDSLRQRFRVEGEAVARLEHENIVRLYEFGEEGGQAYFSMEYVDGQNLAARIRNGPLPARNVAQLVATLARAVQIAHDASVVHRDLKPANVLIDQAGRVKLTDFGLAKLLDGDTSQTRGDIVIGTVAYMSPEQTRGGVVGPATDIYSIGVILYESLTGRPPFAGSSRAETVDLVRNQTPPALRSIAPGISRDLEAICLKCLEKSPADRYRAASEIAEDLDRWLVGQLPSAWKSRWLHRSRKWFRSVGRPITACLIIAVLVALTAISLRERPHSSDTPEQDKVALSALEDQLADGGSVTLIDQTGGPKWFRWRTDPTIGALKVDPNNPASVSSFGISVLELAPRMPTVPFRFSAEVKHQRSSGPAAFVGIYVAYRETPTPTVPIHQMIGLEFKEILPYDSPPAVLDSSVRILPRFYAEKQQKLIWGATVAGKSERYGVAVAPGQTSWRRLELVVDENQIEAHWDGKPIAPLDFEEVSRKVNELVVAGPHRVKMDPHFQPFVRPEFDPKGAIGVILSNGMVSVRSAVVQIPLSEKVQNGRAQNESPDPR